MSESYDHEKLARLASHLPRLQAEGFGSWTEMRKDDDGAFIMPEHILSTAGQEFIETCYEDGWIRTDLKWSDWGTSVEATSLQEDPTALGAATPLQLAKLLTAIVRADRFVEGTLDGAFDSGLIARILSRASSLAGAHDSDIPS